MCPSTISAAPRHIRGIRGRGGARRAPPLLLATATAAEPICPHPDAERRRSDWRQHRAERAAPSPSRKWHEVPSNMVACRSADDYRALVQRAASEHKLLVAKFFTEDCYVCRTLYPKIRGMAEAEHSDVLWAKLNGSDPDTVTLFQALGISKVPLFHVVQDGQLVAELTASLSPDKLSAFRRELAKHKHAMASSPSSSAPQQHQHDLGAEAANAEVRDACEPTAAAAIAS